MCKFQNKLPENLQECFTCKTKCDPYREMKQLKNWKNNEKTKEVRAYFEKRD